MPDGIAFIHYGKGKAEFIKNKTIICPGNGLYFLCAGIYQVTLHLIQHNIFIQQAAVEK